MAEKFWERVKRILKICIPKFFCKETFLLLLQLLTLYARSMASILVAKLDGQIVQSIVSKNFDGFIVGLCYWMLLSVPAVTINALIRYFTGQIGLCFRTRLVQYAHQKYLSNQTYYRVKNLDGRIKNADQMITNDTQRMCDALARLYSDLAKPIMDLFLYTYSLYHAIGFYGPGSLACFYFVVGNILRFSTPDFGRLAAEQSALEGMFSFIHSRLIQNSEEIAFYRGEDVEHGFLNDSYNQLECHISNVHRLKMPYSVLEKFSLRYVASVLIFSINAVPVFFGDDDASARAGVYMEQRRMLLDLADAIQRVMESYKEVMEVSGYVARVSEMIEVFDDVSNGKYEKQYSAANRKTIEALEKQTPEIIESENRELKFENVPIVTPNGDVLLKSLDLNVMKGMHLIIVGPNGCGKSSLFRTMGGLWPAKAGKLTRPKLEKMIWIPQNAYLSLGTLKEQIIYPLSGDDFDKNGGTAKELDEIMKIVNLHYIVEREGGWETRKNWKDRLSGGEKQRVGMARMFFHKPHYAILDECTSQVSIDMEGKMYTKAKEMGINLITVSHRSSLWKYHSHVLQMDGEGHAELVSLEEGSKSLNIAEEKQKLEAQLSDIKQQLKKIGELHQGKQSMSESSDLLAI